MSQQKMIVERHTIMSFLNALATYVSLLSPLLGAVIVWQGLRETKYIFLFYAVLPLFLAVFWLVSQYRLAKRKIRKEGLVQQPAWFWKFVTNKIPHKSEQLLVSQIMVFVPPGKQSYAEKLGQEYNVDGNHILLFHYVPEPTNGVIDEDLGRISVDGEVRTLETLADEMNECAALVLLDDAKWKETYDRTIEVVEAWTKRHTVRPVMSVHLEGRGTLNFSWNHFEDLIKPSHSLKNRLLAQSTNRGANWFWQARLYRRMILWAFGFALVAAPVYFYIAEHRLHNARTSETAAVSTANELKKTVTTLQKSASSDPSAQQEIARAFENYRSTRGTGEGDRLRRLLYVHADQIRITLAKASGENEAMSGSVMMFSVKVMGEREYLVQEVAATRLSLNKKPFPVKLAGDNETSDVTGLVACSVVTRAFVHWSGGWEGKNVQTLNMSAWDLQGKPVGHFFDDRIDIDNVRCRYQKRNMEDLHRHILCSPVGLDLNSDAITPAGAICVTYPHDVKFLQEDWVRQTLTRFGTGLSFISWDKALVGGQDDSNRPNKK